MRKKIIMVLGFGVLASAAQAEAPIERNVGQLLAENTGKIIEVQNVPQQKYISQGKNFGGGLLSETGLFTWCEISSSGGGALNLQSGDKLFIFRGSSSLANGAANHDSEAASLSLVGVRDSKLVRIDLDCEPAIWHSISTEQLNLTLRNYFHFTGRPASELEKQEVIKAVLNHDDGAFYGKTAEENFIRDLEYK